MNLRNLIFSICLLLIFSSCGGSSSKQALLSDSVSTFSGTIDTTYGNNGYIYTGVNPSNSVGTFGKMKSTPEGKLFLLLGKDDKPAVADLYKYDSSGNLDSTFGAGGMTTLDFSSCIADPRSSFLVVDSSENVYAGAETPTTTCIKKIDSTGSLASGFGTNGTLTINDLSFFSAVLTDNDANLVLSGISDSGTVVSAQLGKIKTSNGTFESSFGTGGFFTYVNGANNANYFTTVGVDSNGYLYTAGIYASSHSDTTGTVFVAKVKPDGSNFVSDFGTDGIKDLKSITDTGFASRLIVDGDYIFVHKAEGSGGAGIHWAIYKIISTTGDLEPKFGAVGVIWQYNNISRMMNFAIVDNTIAYANLYYLNGDFSFYITAVDKTTGQLDTSVFTEGIFNQYPILMPYSLEGSDVGLFCLGIEYSDNNYSGSVSQLAIVKFK